jgi:hypothetical protein
VKVPVISRLWIFASDSLPPMAVAYFSSTASTEGDAGGAAVAPGECAAAASARSGGIEAGSFDP